MLAKRADPWVESYLYRARGHRALEQSVFAAGERLGFSERLLRRAGRRLAVNIDSGCWELHPVRAAALAQHELAELALIPQVAFAPPLERRVA